MHVAIDACCWSNRRGFGRFTRELVTHVVSEHPAHEYTLLVDRATAVASRFPAGARVVVVDTDEAPTAAASAAGARSLRDLWRMARAAARVPAHVLFFPAVYSFFPVLRRVPTLVTFHDVIAESHPRLVFPGARSRLFWTAKSWMARRQADRMVTVSAHARARIAAAFGRGEETIDVIPEGPADVFRPIRDLRARNAALARYGLPPAAPLVLYVGGISPHKNLDGLLHAFARLPAPAHLAIAGDYSQDSFLGCHPQLLDLRARLGLDARVTFTGFVPDEDLALLYNAATVLALPSFDEGFGLPAVEAMACGLPVAASRAGSLPEVVGDAGLFFDPRDPAEIAATLARILEEAELRGGLAAQATQRASRFTWSAAAAQAVRLFESAAGGPAAGRG